MALEEIVHPWYKVLLIWWGLLVQNMMLTPLFFQQFPDPVCEQLGILASGDRRILCQVKKH